jgi:GH24 family phage-related lysozyme (muramidase)
MTTLDDLDFQGDAAWVHQLEGHAGRPYWPGGQSGVTLDPGVDLGYADESLVVSCYDDLLTAREMQTCIRAMGIVGTKACRRIERNERLQSIRITEEQATAIFSQVAMPYWRAARRRWPEVTEAPPPVQTVVLSLCYNRGPSNDRLSVIGEPLRAKDYEALADVVEEMQDDHRLVGIQQRRDTEAQYVRRRVRRRKLEALAEAMGRVRAADPEPLPRPDLDDLSLTIAE